jgi:ADP-heptose:LPS heptosyltransferase
MIPKSIAVYTDGEVLGDGIIKLQFAGALKKAFPQARLVWLVGGKTVYDSVLADLAHTLIDEIICLPQGRVTLGQLWGAKFIQGRRFDLLIDTQHKVKRALWLKNRVKHGQFISAAAHFLLSDSKPPRKAKKKIHVLDQVMQLAQLALGKDLSPVPIVLPDKEKWQSQAQQILPPGPRYIGLMPGASIESKRWPLENFIQLARGRVDAGDVPVFILGPAEQELAPQIGAALPQAIIPDTGHPCLTMALAGCMTAIVANDSGGGHLAATAGAPMVILIRSNSVRQKFLPVTPRLVSFTPQDFLGREMSDIPFDAVFKALNEIIE